jgi:D-aspartate ligase
MPKSGSKILSRDSSCPVVVVGGSVVGLGVVRSLSTANSSVVILDTSRFNPALLSRYCKGRVIASLSGDLLVDELKAISTGFATRPLLILTQDAAVETVSRDRDALEPFYRFLLPPKETVDMLNDKARFHDFATRAHFPVPDGLVVDCIDHLARIDGLPGPLVVKPARKVGLEEFGLDRASRFDSPAEARARCVALLNLNTSAIVQQWVDGPDCEIYFCLFFCDPSGQPLRSFTGRKLSAYPPGVGSTATCIAAPEAHEELEAITARLTAMTEYAGLGGVEFKRDAKTGKFVIIEPTVGRTDWQEEIASLSGANIPMAAFLHATGQPVPRLDATPGQVAWRTSLKHRAPASLLAANVKISDGYWRASDPLPGMVFYGIEPVRRIVHFGVRNALIYAMRWVVNKARKFGVRSLTDRPA